ncbi:MAG: hypothetical protein ACREP6_01070 [Candidatus Binataceae bacterium]
MLPDGDYSYEIRRDGRLVALEDNRLKAGRISGVRRIAEGSDRYEAEALLDHDGAVSWLGLRYIRGPFTRGAAFEVAGDFLRGSVSALGSRDNIVVKLGRYREVDADLALFKAVIIGHARVRGQTLFTSRIATIDPNTLMVASYKQTWRQAGDNGLLWINEPRMGDSETIEIDENGWLIRRTDARGNQTAIIGVKGEKIEQR